jgi:diguanylate cyclase (GGDEF)-like protein
MTFRVRLAFFFFVTLVAMQALTALLIYKVTRDELIAEGERQLTIAGGVFERQLDDAAERVAGTVQVLSLDYALRAAIGRQDRPTLVSALRNHGRRVGASRMELLALDGTILADTVDAAAEGQAFRFHDLVDSSLQRRSTALVAVDGHAFLSVVVPVLAPVPIALIAAYIPIDDAMLVGMQKLSSLPKLIELVAVAPAGGLTLLAASSRQYGMAGALLSAGGGVLPDRPVLAQLNKGEYVGLAILVARSDKSAPVTVVLGYSLDEALRPFRAAFPTFAMLLAAGLTVGIFGAMLIARGVSRPVEQLARAARQIEAGDYSPPAAIERKDEIGQLAGAFGTMVKAIGEREERIRYQAEHDMVTGLPNRLAAERAIGAAIRANPTEPAALIMVGMTRLPEITKTMGHEIADHLMRDAARRLGRMTEPRVIARVSDTSFAIWQAELGKADAVVLARHIVELLGRSYQEGALAIDMTPAAGIALHPVHGADAASLLRRADIALFAASGAEQAAIVYDPATDPHRPERLSLMGDLRTGLERGELRLHYQPKYNLAQETIDAAEALVRWTHPTRGFIPPDSFIGLAEETGNIQRLTRWALATGAAQAGQWRAKGWGVRIGVNLSVHDLADQDLPRRVIDLLDEEAIPAESLMLEVTESAVMGEPDAAIAVLRQLSDLGLDLAIDDFGVGQSSFAYLRRLPVREIKIDKSFVQKLAEDADDRIIVQSIVELGHRLRYRVTAEGVEDAAALDYLKDVGCDYAQGYHITKALPTEAFEKFVSNGAWRVNRREGVS